MKNFTKWLSLALALVMMVGVLAGCAQPPVASTNGQTNNPTNGENDPTTPSVKPTEPEDIETYTEAPYTPTWVPMAT